MSNQKQLWVLAGGNGAGKSTFYKLYLKPRGLHFVNADLIASDLSADDPEGVSYEAAYLAEKIRFQLLKEGASFCFETVYSHPSKIDFVAHAKALGYKVILVYIHLSQPNLNMARVRQRVSEGGHDVPMEKIKTRIPRTIINVGKTISLADEVRLLDNSSRSSPFKLIATLKKGVLLDKDENLTDWARQILKG